MLLVSVLAAPVLVLPDVEPELVVPPVLLDELDDVLLVLPPLVPDVPSPEL